MKYGKINKEIKEVFMKGLLAYLSVFFFSIFLVGCQSMDVDSKTNKKDDKKNPDAESTWNKGKWNVAKWK